MFEIDRNPLPKAFLGQIPNEAAFSVLKHFSGKSLFRLKEVDYHANRLVIGLLQFVKYWRELGFTLSSVPNQFQVERAISVIQSAGRIPTVWDMPRESRLSWRILVGLNITPIHAIEAQKLAEQAARFGDVELCREALNPPHIRDLAACMCCAIKGRHLDVVEMLIDLGAPVSRIIFRFSIIKGLIEIAKRLVNHNPDLRREVSDLQWAAFLGRTEDLDELARRPGAFKGINRLPGPLLLAAMNGHTEAIKELVRLRDSIIVENLGLVNETALHFAAKRGRTEAIKELKALGCPVDARDDDEQTALHYAARRGHVEAINELKALGCNIRATDFLTQTALHKAAAFGHTEAVKVLKELGCPVDAVDHKGQTALHEAAKNGHTDMIKVLVDLGCPVGAMDYEEKTAKDYAGFNKYTVAIKVLERLEAAMLAV